MPKIIKRKIVVPELTRKGFELMQEGACSDEARCKSLSCKDCLFDNRNLDHFIVHLDLKEIHGTITVREREVTE